MEARFDHDFSQVRVHDGARAADSARAVGALAYTVGRDIVFEAGHYAPSTESGKRLLAHELGHVVQQQAAVHRSGLLSLGDQSSAAERQAAAFAEGPTSAPHPGIAWATLPPTVQRQGNPPVLPTGITTHWTPPAHAPACDPRPLEVTTNGTQVTWTLESDPTAVDATTTITPVANANPERAGITIGAGQAAGQIAVKAENAAGSWRQPFSLRSHPTGITSTSIVGLASADNYGAVFDHVFTSADGNVASLERVGVGERFIGVPNPTAATHAIVAPTNPFGGTFTLHTATLTPNASDNWFLTAAGGLGGSHDSVTSDQAGINVGLFIRSASNPNPPQALPASMTLTQGLHWYCPQAPGLSRWRMPAFVQPSHSRTLRESGGNVEFATAVNGVEQVDNYVGKTGVFNATVAARMARVTADTLPSALPTGSSLGFSIAGAAQGSTIAADPADDHAAILTLGAAGGPVTVDIADSTGTNRDQVTVS